MNILNRLTVRNLRLNKKRTLVTIIGIILSTAMICAVAGMVSSFQQTLINTSIKEDGNYHVTFKNVPQEELKYIENNRGVASYFLTQGVGYAKLKDSQNLAKPYIYLYAYDENALKNYAVNLVEGRLPQNSSEILISEHIITNGKVQYKIGDKINLDIGTRMTVDGYKLQQNNSYANLLEDVKENEREDIYNTESREFTIVGIMERPNYSTEPYSAPGYTAITYMEENFTGNANISVLYIDPKNYKETTNVINGVIEGENDNNGRYDTKINRDLLRWQGAALSESTMQAIVSIASVVIIIIILSSVFVIRNSFSISITERYKQYGMLASIGATSKQIKRNVVFEGFVLGLIAIPLGILLGMFAVAVLLWLVNVILEDALESIRFVYSIPLLPIVISVFLSGITIYLSSLLPARRAAKISPIEAIRSNNDIKIKGKKLKTPKIIKRLFNVGGSIAYKNLKRNKKKYRTTVISLVVSVAIFIALSSFIEYGFKISNVYFYDVSYQIVVNDKNSNLNATMDNAYNNLLDVSKLNNVVSNSIHKYTFLRVDMNKYGNKEEKLPDYFAEQQSIEVLSIGEDAYKEYVKKLGGKYEDYKKGGILIDTFIGYDNENKIQTNVYNVKEGEYITGVEEGKPDNKQTSIKIIKRTDQKPMGLEGSNSYSGYLIVSEELFNQFNKYDIDALYINSNNPDKLCEDIDNLIKTDNRYSEIEYINLMDYVKQNNAMVLVISIFLYGFITVITLIGVTNIFNTITTNMKLRSKEFAMLKAVGMTSVEFNKMIRLESLFYGLKSLLIGVPIGIGFSYWIYTGFNNSVETAYQLPFVAIGIAVLFVFVIVGLTMKYSLNKIDKQNIIETIREDNI